MKPSAAPRPATTLRDQLVQEAAGMIRHALSSGVRVTAALVQTVERYDSAAAGAPPADLGPLVQAHERLAALVAPATPRAILLLCDDGTPRGRLGFLGPIPMVRRMMVVSALFTLWFMVSTVLRLVRQVAGEGPLGVELHPVIFDVLQGEVFCFAAAGAGASFALLSQLNEQIVTRTVDPHEEPAYWTKLLLGILAGFILVALSGVEPPPAGATGESINMVGPTLALVGGFSASLVYRILNRLVEAVDAKMGSRPEAAASAATPAAADDGAQTKLGLAARIMDLQLQVSAGSPQDELHRRIRDIMTTLVPEPASSGAEPVVTPARPAPPAALPAAGETTPEAPVAAVTAVG
jgi:hypothetical protein